METSKLHKHVVITDERIEDTKVIDSMVDQLIEEQAHKDFDEEDETHEKNLLAHGFD